MKHQLILTGLLLVTTSSVFGQSYFDDDIYYNPDKNKTTKTTKAKKQSNYIANMADLDVDTYNRRDQYYLTPVDTIGRAVENGEDFVYTQQIQKYYNPTIVVDNADILGDVLANAYGNVEIVINDAGLPIFTPYYSYGWPYYNRWGWNIGGWGWNVSFYDPWYAWNWGPSWGWGPSWTWGPSWAWGPSWGWGPGWGWTGPIGPTWGGRPPMADWRPNGNRPVGPAPGWSGNHRPGAGGGSFAHNTPSYGMAGGGSQSGNISTGRPASNNHRPMSGGNATTVNTRPAAGNGFSKPAGSTGVVNNNGKWEYVNGGHRVPQGTVNSGRPINNSNVNTSRPVTNGTINTGRPVNNGTVNSNRNQNTNRGTSNNRVTTTNRNNYNSNQSTGSSNRSFNTGRSTNTGRSSGGSFGGVRSSGGTRSGGGGRHR